MSDEERLAKEGEEEEEQEIFDDGMVLYYWKYVNTYVHIVYVHMIIKSTVWRNTKLMAWLKWVFWKSIVS